MRLQNIFVEALGLASLSQAARIYVSSYSGNISTVALTPKADGNLSLTSITLNTGCSPSPSWLELDNITSTLYCADEGTSNSTQASFSSFQTSSNGTLTLLNKIATPNGGVYSTIYSNDAVAIAHYGGSAISIANITSPASMNIFQETLFSFANPYPNATNPLQPYIYQTLLDPTQEFLFAADLTADIIHVFSITSSNVLQKPSTQPDIIVPTGHGPRHGVFYQPRDGSNATYVYFVMETANMVHGYEVTYNSDTTLNFTMIQDFQLPVPQNAAAAEIKLTPDNNYLIVSSRNDKNSTMANFDTTNSTQMVSDTLFTFAISPSNGTFTLLQAFPAGGISPRQFSINANGTMVAVALNIDNRLTVIARDVASGMMTGILGYLNLDIGCQPGMVTSAVWDEDGEGGNGGGNVTSTVTSSMISTLLITVTEASSVASGTSQPTAPMPSTGTGYSSSVGVQPSTTSGPSGGASPPSTPVATPSPFQTGMVGDCTNFYLVASGDTCNSITTAVGISLSDFYTWNPAVGSSCKTLFLDNNVCIGVGS